MKINRNYKFLVLVLLITIQLSFLSLSAQVKEDSGIVFNTTSHRFGILKEGTDAVYAFSFINKKNIPVAVTQVKMFCSCIVPDWTKKPVMPNDTGKITIRFHANTTGTFSKTIYIYIDGNSIPFTLNIKGEVSEGITRN